MSKHVKLQEPRKLAAVDKLLVLGRGIKATGELTKTGFERAEIAAEIASWLLPSVVVFSGGRSWRQVLGNTTPPSEGGAMLRHALAYGTKPPLGVEYVAEEDSESTVANMVNSYDLLNMQKGETLGIISDDLHFVYNRVQYIAGLVFPGTVTHNIRIPRVMTDDDMLEEKRTALATRVAMFGVQAGKSDVITHRQQKLESANKILRLAQGGFMSRSDEIAEPVGNEMSYQEVLEFRHITPPVLSGVLVGQL